MYECWAEKHYMWVGHLLCVSYPISLCSILYMYKSR